MLRWSKRGAAVQAALLLLLLLIFASLAPLMLLPGTRQAAALRSRLGQSFGCNPTRLAATARGKVYLRYDVQQGLCNQLNGHVNALMLAHALGVDAVLVPPAWSRSPDSFNHNRYKQSWFKDNPATTLLDLDTMAAEWAQRGMRLVEAMTKPQQLELHGCIRTPALQVPPELKFHMAPLTRLVAQARADIDAVWAVHGPSTCVMLDGGLLFLAANLSSTANLAASAAATLRFPPHIEGLADRIVKYIGPTFNGVHLRVEPDMGLNPEAIIPKYIALMRELGFNSTTPLYMASALLSYGDATGFDHMATRLCKERLCSQVVAKERILPAAAFKGLNSEQLALVDLLVLVRTARFVGHRKSTFSFMANNLRVMRTGVSRESGQLVGVPKNYLSHANNILPTER